MTTRRKTAILLATAALVAPAAFAQPEPGRCEFRDARELSGPATETLEIESGAGAVEIEGDAELGEMRVSAILCASSQELLDGLDVSLANGRLETRYPAWRSRIFNFGGNRYASISLGVRVPAGTAVELEDKSGSAAISNVARARVDDGSGSLRIRGVEGDVRVEDGSGSLTIEDVTGDVSVEDGSGSLTIRDVAGNVTLEDGSGGARVRGVTGNVVVTDDGSGGIEIEEVGGEVRVSDAGSGSVRVRDVEGGLTVTGVRRSRIDYENVRGEVDLPPDRRRGRR